MNIWKMSALIVALCLLWSHVGFDLQCMPALRWNSTLCVSFGRLKEEEVAKSQEVHKKAGSEALWHLHLQLRWMY